VTPGQPAGVTGTVVLAESHLAIHTWPEIGAVTLDVYVCNFSGDNSNRAHALFDEVIARFARPVEKKEVARGHLGSPLAD
jgi:S-adenosylmethionine/arginine decarboxylase-like enzyme